MRTLIKNGLVYDGSGGTPFRKDVLIKDGFIEAVTESAEAYGMEMTRAERKRPQRKSWTRRGLS